MADQESFCNYDVFLSFRGEDTRHTFTGHLYDAFRRKGINIFMDDDGLKGGDQIALSLVRAIQESRISVVVFSENYASSSWCLDELVEIVGCMKMKNQLVWPIFYKVEPSDIRYQRNSYAEAMTKHERRFGKESERMQKWRSALSQVANLKGWHFETGYEYEFIQKFVEMAIAELHHEQLDVGEHIVGHQSCIQEVRSLLHIESRDKVCMVGIHGTGGIGKTTLAKALYNMIFYQFECAIFLESVRETSKQMGLVHLQETMLSKLLEGKIIKLSSVDEGAARLKDRLRHRRILLVLDDVDSVDQLEKLAGNCNWFGSGSRIIITTRDKHVLTIHEVEKRYEMKELNDHEALQLFCWKAFKMSQPATSYEDVSNRAVRYARGLPLALKVIGSNLVGKSIRECECALEQYERIPDRKIQDILKVSYDCLSENAQYVFLDIACFFKGERREYVERILDKCDFYPTYNIGILVDKSLLTVDQYGHLRMHDLIQDMGKEVVRQESPRRPGERSRLYFHEDVLNVLTENSGSSTIEGILLDPPKEEEVEVEWGGIAFEKMSNLRILVVRNAHFLSAPKYLPSSLRLLEWKGYPSESLPPGFYPRNVVVLSLPHSHFKLEKENKFPKLKHLTELNFSYCRFITHLPDVSGVPSLKHIKLIACRKLISIDESVGFLEKLESLDARECGKLRKFSSRIWLPSLQLLNFEFCNNLQSFPEIEKVMDKPLDICLNDTKIRELPSSVYNLMGLKTVSMSACRRVRNLPSTLFMLPRIVELKFQGNFQVRKSFRSFRNSHVITTISHSPLRRLSCINCGLTDEDLQFILSCFPNLEELILPWNNFKSLPTSIKESSNLTVLDVIGNERLKEIPELPSSIQIVLARGCSSLTSETSRMLWSQALKEVYKLHVLMPESQFPNWFDHQYEGGIVSFWARGQFPIVALAFLFKDMPLPPRILVNHSIRIHLYINGREVVKLSWSGYGLEGDHVFLCDVRSGVGAEEWPIRDMLHASDWNHVEFKCDSPAGLIVSYCGVHVYKQETNMQDIQFTRPNPLKRKPSITSHKLPKKRVRMLKSNIDKRKTPRWWNMGNLLSYLLGEE
ncbi:TMV resistance protein N-like isoform X1 [Abrus precatorius]|uniref:TMV resistance protein N-like isoform X1 n=1 Tax=Abrus precatorius TaxID=3816 RepID=A0A8B8JIS3_ABRPR|nr:TMV resistance protein N-like isoform X1 [Abrus precatorius]